MREEFRNVLSGITEELRKDRSLREIEDHAEPLLIRLLKGIGLEKSKTDEQLAHFGLEGLAHYNRVIAWSSDQLFHTEARPLLQQAVMQRAKQYEKSLTPMLLYGNRLVMIVNSIHPISKSDLYPELIMKRAFLMNEMESLGIDNQGVTVGVGNLVHGWHGIAQSYGEAVYAGSFHSIHRSDEVLFRQDLVTDIKENHNEPLEDVMNTMVDCVIHKELDRVQANTTVFFRRLESRERYRMVDVRMYCAEVMFLLDLRIKEIHPDMQGFNKAEALEKVLQASTLLELKQWFAEQLERASLHIKRLSRVAPNRYVMEAKQFVDKHYAEKIRLEDMAETMHLNAKYFSSLFKKESGMNFIDYVNEVRIRKASDLIFRSDHMINEIAYMVGFQNLSHFNKLFRKATSMTPLAYRIRVRIE
jgi:AraC-like DNA-binding protein